jgi:hypothetical protein
MPAKSLPVARFDESADRQLPALLWARAQSAELFRIHAEGARHPDLSAIESADALRIPPRLLVALSMLFRHVTTSRCRSPDIRGACSTN